MGLFSIFKRAPSASTGGVAEAATLVASARTIARRRLVGAVLLLGIGVIAFPLLFETQPRPIPVDIAIEIPRKEGAPALAMPPSRSAAASAPLPATTSTTTGASAPVAPAAAVPMITERKAEAAAPAPTPATRKPEVATTAPAPVPAARKPDPAVTQAKAEPVPAKPAKSESPAVADAKGRFVVQVGAYADPGLASEARSKLEKMGLRTYTQVVDTEAGKRTRVRLGPYAGREEADKAAAQVKAAGLPAAVLTL